MFTCKYCIKGSFLAIARGAWVWSCRIQGSRYTGSGLVAAVPSSLQHLDWSLWRLCRSSGLLDPVAAIYAVLLRCREYLMFSSNVIKNSEGFSKRVSILSVTIMWIISLSLCSHCCLACGCRPSRSGYDAFYVHIIYVILFLSRIDVSWNVMFTRCQENDPLSTGFLLNTYSWHTINIPFHESSNLLFCTVFSSRYYRAVKRCTL